MDKQFAIFDMDGTLVNSMPAWNRVGVDYLESKGITPPQELFSKIKAMTLIESARYFQSLGAGEEAQQIVDKMNAIMAEHYKKDIPLCLGAAEYLEKLHQRGVKMCIATATNEKLANACLERLGIRKYFSFILSCEDVGKGKSSPDVYLLAAQKLGAKVEQACVYEDAAFAAATAKNAGFYTIGVYDPAAGEENRKELISLCDAFIEQYSEV